MIVIDTRLTRAKYAKLSLLSFVRGVSFYLTIVIFIIFLAFALLTDTSLFPAFGFIILMILVMSVSILLNSLSSKNRNFFLPTQFTFGDENVSIKTDISEETLKWGTFIRWKKRGEFYLLYISRASCYVINNSDIPSQDISTFEALLRNNIKSK